MVQRQKRQVVQTSRSARYCPVCLRSATEFIDGPGGRPQARCPHCRSVERHRFLAILLEGLAPVVAAARVVLDIAPSAQTTTLFQRLNPTGHVRLDLNPARTRGAVDVQASMTQLPLPDGSVDFALCYHVLEHIPDDAAALAELCRVLSDGGLALVQVPWRPRSPTDEDPWAPAPERVRRFGQADHVRFYGSDFPARLEQAGLSWLRITPREALGPRAVEMFRLMPNQAVWFVRRAGRRPSPVAGAAALQPVTLATLIERVPDLAPPAAPRRRLPARLAGAAAHPVRTVRRLSARWS